MVCSDSIGFDGKITGDGGSIRQDRAPDAATPRRSAPPRSGRASADLASAAVLLAAVAMMQSAGPKLLVSLRLLMQQALSEPTLQFTRPQLLRFASLIAQSLLPLLGVVVLVAAVVNALQFGLLFRFRLNEEAFDMAKGFDRLFSPRSRVRVVLDLVKLLAVGWVSYILVRSRFQSNRLSVATGCLDITRRGDEHRLRRRGANRRVAACPGPAGLWLSALATRARSSHDPP